MPDTAERLATLETIVRGLDERQRNEIEERRKRTHDLANHMMNSDRILQEIKVALAPLSELPQRIKGIEDSIVTKEGLKKDLLAFGIDPTKPSETAVTLKFASDLLATGMAAKRHLLLVTIAVMATGMCTGVWAMIKSGAHP